MFVPIDTHREEAAVMPGGERNGGVRATGGAGGDAPALPPETLLLKRHFTAENLPLVRAQVEDTAAAAGLGGVRLGEFTLAVSEIAANAVEHAGGQGRLELRLLPHELECRITDDGPGFTPAIPELLPGLTGTCPGRGLWLAHLVTDRLTVTTDTVGAGAGAGTGTGTGTEVTLAMRLG
ncbi:ATP-binding protein [Streptomyces sp. DSM 3412]|uniref:ATP-binding protein n=2 Tax=Streptomyces gottesmaniae TaxID=3075518 RepID=A0ABU2Z7G9_9ACTN|nr:ATP-binding protein [Streptomyces sp. DSM 3412]MDT0572540.1 ATP-binding protein [Streptomyces sp. DSM 3412]